MKGLTILERFFLVVGLFFLAVFGGDQLLRTTSSTLAVREFEAAQAAAEDETIRVEEATDFRLWSPTRVAAYRSNTTLPGGMRRASAALPLAVLSIHKAGIRAPVYGGTDALALDLGVGWIAGTARPGEAGNIGVAGHRDGFFRGLKDVSLGDAIELSTLREMATYTVDRIQIVKPQDTGVLKRQEVPSVTLVTCYPFYYIGDAPKRYIVHASLAGRTATRRDAK